MKMKWGWLIASVMIVLVAALLAVRLWFNAPGIRVLGREIHVDLSQTCYIIDGQTGELLDETALSIQGATSRSDRELFEGSMKILGYQNSASGTITALKAIETTEDGCWIITHLENCTHRETDENGVTKDVEHFCDYSYTYYLYPENPEDTVVLIESFNQYKPMYAVCADGDEAALDRYQEFLEQHT